MQGFGMGVGYARACQGGLIFLPGNWERKTLFRFWDPHFPFQFLCLGQTMEASRPLSPRALSLSPPRPCRPLLTIPPLTRQLPQLRLQAEICQNRSVETDYDCSRWAGFDSPILSSF